MENHIKHALIGYAIGIGTGVLSAAAYLTLEPTSQIEKNKLYLPHKGNIKGLIYILNKTKQEELSSKEKNSINTDNYPKIISNKYLCGETSSNSEFNYHVNYYIILSNTKLNNNYCIETLLIPKNDFNNINI